MYDSDNIKSLSIQEQFVHIIRNTDNYIIFETSNDIFKNNTYYLFKYANSYFKSSKEILEKLEDETITITYLSDMDDVNSIKYCLKISNV